MASTENVFSGYALWLVPSPASALSWALTEEMESLRQRNAGKSSESFGIHATLLAGLGDREIDPAKLAEVTREAVKQWSEVREEGAGGGLKVMFDEVTTRGSYFQCILIALNQNPSLMRLNSITRTLVDTSFPPAPTEGPPTPYFPHISLLYASLSAEEAQKQIEGMEKDGIWKRTGNGAEVRGFTEVEFRAVEVWDCTGTPGEWKSLYSIPLYEPDTVQ